MTRRGPQIWRDVIRSADHYYFRTSLSIQSSPSLIAFKQIAGVRLFSDVGQARYNQVAGFLELLEVVFNRTAEKRSSL